jgi:hypothetical protein
LNAAHKDLCFLIFSFYPLAKEIGRYGIARIKGSQDRGVTGNLPEGKTELYCSELVFKA